MFILIKMLLVPLWTIIDGFPRDRRAGGEKLLERDQNLWMSQNAISSTTPQTSCLCPKVDDITAETNYLFSSALYHIMSILYTFK